MVDVLKSRLTDPCITCHWGVIGCDTTTLATIHITSPEVQHIARLVFWRAMAVEPLKIHAVVLLSSKCSIIAGG